MVRSTNNSLSSVSTSNASAGSSSSSSAVASSSGASTTLSANSEVLAQAFSKALGESLPGIFASFQAQLSTPAPPSLENLPAVARADVITETPAVSCQSVDHRDHLFSMPSTAPGLVPSFISTFSMLQNPVSSSRVVAPLFMGAPAMSDCDFTATTFSMPIVSHPPTFDKAFVVGQGYAPIPYKLVGKITGGQFVDLADLLSDNIRVQESEPQAFLDGKLVVATAKTRMVEVVDIPTWIEAFIIYSMIKCSAHPSRWADLT